METSKYRFFIENTYRADETTNNSRIGTERGLRGCRSRKTVVSELGLNLSEVTFHTDSETVLKWINSISAKLSVFVGNRIGKIRRDTALIQWHHIPGKKTFSDVCSRTRRTHLSPWTRLFIAGLRLAKI